VNPEPAIRSVQEVFWLHRTRLDGLLSAKRCRDQSHDVLMLKRAIFSIGTTIESESRP
jgi:hypothetical protein